MRRHKSQLGVCKTHLGRDNQRLMVTTFGPNSDLTLLQKLINGMPDERMLQRAVTLCTIRECLAVEKKPTV